MKFYFSFILIFKAVILIAQEAPSQVLSYDEYLAYVKKYHPMVRQANLQLERGEAQLLKARGAFDPKIEVDYKRKEFKGTEYYDILNSTFKIPTWYGLELKAGFEQNEGLYLNPERTVPPEGLFSAGISLSALQGLLIDERRAVLQAAKALRDQNAAERDLRISQILFEAAEAYLEWARLYRQMEVFNEFVTNAKQRFGGISRSAATGEIAAIDTVEAGIALQDRRLQLEQTRVKLLKQRLQVANFLWLENDLPVELQPAIVPEPIFLMQNTSTENVENWLSEFSFEEHPKIEALEAKLQALQIERRLKLNNLLPTVDLEYNLITAEPELAGNYNTSNYKAGLKFNFPLFLRKERGELKLAAYKLEDASLELEINRRILKNKIDGLLQELESYREQIKMTNEIAENYQQLLNAEERKFSFGESSLFLINSRENKLIEAKLKQNELLIKYLVTRAELLQSLGLVPEVEE